MPFLPDATPDETVTLPAKLLFDLIAAAMDTDPGSETIAVARWFLAQQSPAWHRTLLTLDRCAVS